MFYIVCIQGSKLIIEELAFKQPLPIQFIRHRIGDSKGSSEPQFIHYQFRDDNIAIACCQEMIINEFPMRLLAPSGIRVFGDFIIGADKCLNEDDFAPEFIPLEWREVGQIIGELSVNFKVVGEAKPTWITWDANVKSANKES